MTENISDRDISDYLTQNNTDALIIIGDINNSDLFYATQFFAADSFTYIQSKENIEILFVPDMERERAAIESRVHDIRTLSDYKYQEKLKYASDSYDAYCECLGELLRDLKVRRVSVPKKFPLYIAQYLKEMGFTVLPIKSPFRKMRTIKSENEINNIKNVQSACEQAMKCAVTIIEDSEVLDGLLYYKNKPLTSEYVKSSIEHKLIDLGCQGKGTIVSCGKDAAIPHHRGKGNLSAGEPIVIDIFPQSKNTLYYSDMCRTVIKGDAPKNLLDMYNAVLESQEEAIKMIKPGMSCGEIHKRVCAIFEEKGYDTHLSNSKYGFIHATGHGVGIEVHEDPKISENDEILEEGNVITIEPGLYYPSIGGIRVEDIILVTSDGYENLTGFEKKFVV